MMSLPTYLDVRPGIGEKAQGVDRPMVGID
jgi:hypothetical protein